MRSSVALCGLLAIAIALLGKAQASIFDQARAKLSDFTAPALLEVRAPLVALENWIEGLGTLFSVYQENLDLKRENAELRRWQDVALSLENRVRRYEQLLNSVPEALTPSITARVIGESNRPFVKTMILNAGTEHGVRKGQAVVDDRGLIGRIYLTGERTSWVILLTDLSSRVPVMMESTQRRAILSGDNTQAPMLDLDLVGGTASPGDRVLSTGDGGLLPAGVPVGVVVKDGRALRVALFAASAGDYVRVLDYHLPPPPAASGATPASLGLRPTASDRARPSVTASTTLVQKGPTVAPAPRATPAATVSTASVQKAPSPPPAPRAALPSVEAPAEPLQAEPPSAPPPSEEPAAIVVQEGDYVPPSEGGEVR